MNYNDRYHCYNKQSNDFYQEKLKVAVEHLKEFSEVKLDERQRMAIIKNQTIIERLKKL